MNRLGERPAVADRGPGSRWRPTRADTTIAVCLAPEASGVDGADLAAAAQRRYTGSARFTCRSQGAGADTSLDCEGALIAHVSTGKAGIEVWSADATLNVVDVARGLAAGH